MSLLKDAMDRLNKTEPANERDRESTPQDMDGDSPVMSSSDSDTIEFRQTRVLEYNHDALRQNKAIALLDKSMEAEQFKLLRTQILEKLARINGNSILITSPNPGAGKTFTSVNLAISMAQEVGRTTLLLDADLRQPRIDQCFGFSAQRGLTDYLLGELKLPDVLVNPGIPKLTILPGGMPLPNSTELLGSPKMEALIKELKGRYKDRFLIVDSASLMARADPIVSSRHIDGILMIIEMEKTSRSDLQRAMELIKDKPVLGMVLNKMREKLN